MTSSSAKRDPHVLSEEAQCLSALQSECEDYHFLILKQLFEECSHINSPDMRDLLTILERGRAISEHFAGILNIQWIAGEWRIDETTTPLRNDNDRQFIESRLLNYTSNKIPLLEKDIKEILFDLVRIKCKELVSMEMLKENQNFLLAQHRILSDIHSQIKKCMDSSCQSKELNRLKVFINEFETLILSRKSNPSIHFFSIYHPNPKTFISHARLLLEQLDAKKSSHPHKR